MKNGYEYGPRDHWWRRGCGYCGWRGWFHTRHMIRRHPEPWID